MKSGKSFFLAACLERLITTSMAIRYVSCMLAMLGCSSVCQSVRAQEQTPAELHQLRESYQQAAERALQPVRVRYLEQLQGLQKRYTQAGKLAEALAVKAEIDRIQSASEIRAAAQTLLDQAEIFRGHRYLLLKANLPFADAAGLCQKLGGHLVAIETENEQEFLERKFLTALKEAGKDAWIGLTDAEKEGVWKWVTGQPITYARWGNAEPNNVGGTENSVVMSPRGVWLDTSGDKPFWVICEWENWPPRVDPNVDLSKVQP